jgi:hypothetical protein
MEQSTPSTNAAPAPIYVICDRCRTEGRSDEDPFAAFGALLDFEPVPRRSNRADGWDEKVQRAFIAALSLTGSVRSACRAVGKSAFGVAQLLAHEGSEGFRAAHDQAMAIAEEERVRRLAEGVRAVAAEQSGWRPPPPPWSQAATRIGPGRPPADAAGHAPEPLPVPAGPLTPDDYTPEALFDAFWPIVGPYMIKVRLEREARLDGRIVEADFYIRQMTWLEVAMDLATGDGFELLKRFRFAGRYELGDIAESTMSRILGNMRRAEWAKAGEPPRPVHPPPDLLVDHGGFSTEPLEYTRGGQPLSHEEQRAVFDQRHARAAAAQLAWEAEARRDYERRQAARE